MKIKKIIAMAAALVMAISATASAYPIVESPAVINNDLAYKYAEAFYQDGYYYEAYHMLEKVDVTDAHYDAMKQEWWMKTVTAKIREYEYAVARAYVKDILDEIKWLYDTADIYNKHLETALDRIDEVNARQKADPRYILTPTEYEKLAYWETVILGVLNFPVDSIQKAIKAVDLTDYKIKSNPYESYVGNKQSNREYHVYILTTLPDGTKENVAGFKVYNDGYVEKAFDYRQP